MQLFYPLMTADEAAAMVKDKMTIAASGFTAAGSIKACGRAIAARAKAEHNAGREFKICLLTGASTGHSVDTALAEANALAFRSPYQTDHALRNAINNQTIPFFDLHLSCLPEYVEYGILGEIDLAIIEATAVSPEGHVYLTTSAGASPTFLHKAKRVVIELNRFHNPRLREMYDVYTPSVFPRCRVIPIHHPLEKIGTPYAFVDPSKIAGIVETNEADEGLAMSPTIGTHEKIGQYIVEFLLAERAAGRIPDEFLPLQSGVGNIANAVLSCFGSDQRIPNFMMYTEVLQDACLDLIDQGRLLGISTCSLTLSPAYLQRVYAHFDNYSSKVVLRPQCVSNNAEVIRRLGLISMNTALEVDIYGNVNSSHVCGTNLMNGIGGSGDFTRNAHISIFSCPSIAKGGKISCIVPMVSHCDHNEHSVQVIVTEHGLADVRGLRPLRRAELIIEKCAHPQYRPLLHAYLAGSRRGHISLDLRHAFDFHLRLLETGSMLPSDS